jgi:hypothetical protein
MIAVDAIGSVGATTAPSTNAALHGNPSIAAWATTATVTVVATTSPTARTPIARAFARKSRTGVKNADR